MYICQILEINPSHGCYCDRALENIQSDTLQYFRASAEKFLEEKDAVEALSAALAVISGNTEIKSRSLITASVVCILKVVFVLDIFIALHINKYTVFC